MNTYYVYILQCSDKSYYVGITNNLEKRILEHQEGIYIKSYTYTYKRRPIELMFNTQFTDVDEAIKFEKQLKGWSRKKKKAIINGDWNLLPELSKNNQNSSTSSE
ncbi:GIY-YIG nuclease family protein [Chishuiella sp.]|uniref:GIY-YIG nuclease family protein n=1 Tax=Chishuiella sp. TaxID=1969467 RepID=UPI0028A9DCE3|nr:GIY-YIG nuclease family protein [Chishuiella sp.]